MCWSLTGKAVVESGPVTQPNHCPTLLSYTIKGSEHYLYRNFMILAIVPDAQITYKAHRNFMILAIVPDAQITYKAQR